MVVEIFSTHLPFPILLYNTITEIVQVGVDGNFCIRVVNTKIHVCLNECHITIVTV